MTTELEPLGVWDCNDKSNAYWWHWPEASQWAQEHIPDIDQTYRAEFYLVDVPYAVLYRWKFLGNLHGELVTETVTQVLRELPPAHLMQAPQ